jgi:hypothetical protein
MVRHSGEPNGTKIDGIQPRQLFQAISWHDLTHSMKSLATPVKIDPFELKPKPSSYCLQHPLTFWYHLSTNTITRNDCDSVCAHLLPALRSFNPYTPANGRRIAQ